VVTRHVPDDLGRDQRLDDLEVAGAKGLGGSPVGDGVGVLFGHDRSETWWSSAMRL
jgi:hypothetical protein